MAFATTDDVAALLGIEIDEDDAQALAALDEATAIIQAYTGQVIEQVSNETITLDGSGTRVLLLPELPVTAIASVEVDGEALTADDFQWSANGYLRRTNKDIWPGDLRNVEITYTHGYAVLPAMIVALTAKLAARMINTPVNAKTEMIGAYSITYAVAALQADELMLLDRWRSGR